jgi:hypothetical protein
VQVKKSAGFNDENESDEESQEGPAVSASGSDAVAPAAPDPARQLYFVIQTIRCIICKDESKDRVCESSYCYSPAF